MNDTDALNEEEGGENDDYIDFDDISGRWLGWQRLGGREDKGGCTCMPAPAAAGWRDVT